MKRKEPMKIEHDIGNSYKEELGLIQIWPRTCPLFKEITAFFFFFKQLYQILLGSFFFTVLFFFLHNDALFKNIRLK